MFARIFLQILDSSIAEDWQLRHIFEDLLKLMDYKDGTIDMTREAISRRLNIPLKVVNEKIHILESPDPKSRDPHMEGRRLERMDEHRDWGWRVVNFEKYKDLKTREELRQRVANHRAKKKFAPPTMPEALAYGKEIELPEKEVKKFMDYHIAKADGEEKDIWFVGRNKMKDWKAAMRTWKSNSEDWARPKSGGARQGGIDAAMRVQLNRELEAKKRELDTIRANYGGMQTWTAADVKRRTVLKDRIKELEKMLEIKPEQT